MKRTRLIRLKAALLIFVFSLNTVIGFACAIGLDMWFNSSHHEENEVTHKCAHEHEADKCRESKDGKDNCCNERVIQFAQVDKYVPQSAGGAGMLLFTALVSTFYNIDVSQTSKGFANIRYFVRSHHPPIPDIRIAIQSFQI